MIEKPKFWSWAQLLVNKYNYHEVLHSRRVNTVQKIKISVNACKDNTIPNILENLLSAVLESRCHLLRLEVVRGKGSNLLVDLTSLDQELLSRTLVRLEEISFTDSICSPLSSEQLVSSKLLVPLLLCCQFNAGQDVVIKYCKILHIT